MKKLITFILTMAMIAALLVSMGTIVLAAEAVDLTPVTDVDTTEPADVITPDPAEVPDDPPAEVVPTEAPTELPEVTAPDPTEVPEPPLITAEPDTPVEDAGPTDTTPTETPAEDPAEGPDLDPGDSGTVTIMGITTVPAIVILCMLIGYGVKVSPLGDEYIPLIVGAAGGVIGFIAYHVMPDFPGTDPIWAIAIGVASGLAATGVHQVFKQLSNKSKGA